MRVGDDSLGGGFGAYVAGPDACKAKEETLVGRKAVNHFVALSLLCFFKCFVSNAQPAEVGNVLTKSELAVYMQRIVDGIISELSYDQLCLCEKLSGILAGPPVGKISFCIVVASFVIKA